MIPRFGLFTLAGMALLLLLGILHRETSTPDTAAALTARLRADGHAISKPARVLWDMPGFGISVQDCPAPVQAVIFDFDEIAGPGIMQAVQAVMGGTVQVQYGGRRFDRFDRWALYRLRLASFTAGLAQGRLVDPPVILLFWPAGCAPKDML